MHILVKNVYPSENCCLLLEFTNGEWRKYNCKQLFNQFPDYKVLENPDVFNQVKVEVGGYGVYWNEDIDLPELELWENSEPYKSAFDGLLSFSDAAERWNIDDSTLRKAVACGKLIENDDVKKFGKQWIVSEQSMNKLFGKIQQNRN